MFKRARGYDTLDDAQAHGDGIAAAIDPHDIEYGATTCGWARRRRAMLVVVVAAGLLVTLLAFLAITIPLVVTQEDDDGGSAKRGLFSFDDIFSLGPRSIAFRWRDGASSKKRHSPPPALKQPGKRLASENASADVLYYDGDAKCIVLQMLTKKTVQFPDPATQTVVFNYTQFNDTSLIAGWYSESPENVDGDNDARPRHVLLAAAYKKRWRHSYFVTLMTYDVVSGELKPFDPPAGDVPVDMNPVWAPTGGLVAYVRANDIFVKNLTNADTAQPIRVTSDGTPSRVPVTNRMIVNGVQSWVYEEEVFQSANALWWSPSATRLAYLRADETDVPSFVYAYYDGVYPTMIDLAYPKAGYPNPIITVKVYEFSSNTTVDMNLPVNASDSYVTAVIWVGDNALAVRVLNRLQNEEKIFLCDPTDGSARLLSTRTSTAWLDTEFSLTFLQESDGSTLRYVDTFSDANGFSRIGVYNASTGDLIRQLPPAPTKHEDKDKWDVLSIIGWSPASRMIFYLSDEGDSMQQHVYSISIDDADGSSKKQLSTESGWWSASIGPMNGDASNLPCYVLYFSGNADFRQVPKSFLKIVDDPDYNLVLESNDKLAGELDKYDLPTTKYMTIDIKNETDDDGANSDGMLNVDASLMLPPRFNRNEQYPVLVKVYGGPGSKAVLKRFTLGFDAYVASQGYIVAQFDGRGTHGRGDAFMHSVYLHLGTYETIDQINAAKYVAKLPYVQSNRMGIWGWSYGGYMTSMVLGDARAKDVFKMGVSVAPGTDWRYYDTVYTERYLRTPAANEAGYNSSASLMPNRVKNFANFAYLLVHGTADDNVHVQQSLELSKELVKQGIAFQQMLYTNSDHAILTDQARPHLYHLISSFLQTNL